MINSISARLTFENARSFVQSQGYDVSQAVLTQSYVRSEVAISSSVTNYRLPIVITDTVNGAAFNTERRVQLQDVHVVSSLFIGLAAPSSSTDAAFEVLSYPSIQAISPGAWNLYLGMARGRCLFLLIILNIIPTHAIYRSWK